MAGRKRACELRKADLGASAEGPTSPNYRVGKAWVGWSMGVLNLARPALYAGLLS